MDALPDLKPIRIDSLGTPIYAWQESPTSPDNE